MAAPPHKLVPGPLSGVTVIDMTQALSGPYATMMLLQLGALVIKVEPPGGDMMRALGPIVNGVSTYFSSFNRGKLSVTLDIKDERDRRILDDLLETADVLVENSRPGVMERNNFGWERVHRDHPHIVMASLTGFGQTGPYSQFAAFDMVAQGMSGLMSITGHPGHGPGKTSPALGDIIPGVTTAVGVVSALYSRDVNGGTGVHIDVAMVDVLFSMLENAIGKFQTDGLVPGQIGSRHPLCSPAQAYKTQDGYMIIAAVNDPGFQRVCEGLGAPQLSSDERFALNENRIKNIDQLQDEMESILTTNSTQHWLDAMRPIGVACGPVNNLQQIIDDPYTRARNMFVETVDPKLNNMKNFGMPIKFPGSFADPTTRPKSPEVDEHREWVLNALRSGQLAGRYRRSKL